MNQSTYTIHDDVITSSSSSIILIIMMIIHHQPALPANWIITIVLGSEDGVRVIAIFIAAINSFKSALCWFIIVLFWLVGENDECTHVCRPKWTTRISGCLLVPFQWPISDRLSEWVSEWRRKRRNWWLIDTCHHHLDYNQHHHNTHQHHHDKNNHYKSSSSWQA